MIISNFYSIEQTIFTIVIGFLAGLVPNDKSNIHPLLLAGIVGSFIRKIIYGDFDNGYKWSIDDLYFWLLSIFLGVFGGFIAINVKGL